MDSGNSGSMQSSSGGDEEYDSRADETISPFFNHHPSLTFPSISNHHPPPPPNLSHHHHNHPPPTLFDPHPQPHNLVSFSHSPSNNPIFPNPNTTTTSTSSSSSLYNINLDSSVWSRSGLRSEPNPNYTTDFGTLPSSSSLTQSQLGLHGPNQGPFPTSSSPPPMPLQPSNISGGRGGGATSGTTTTTTSRSDQTNAVKNSRKRTRASRRAPTTVLTTDTSNFRQMVQEFTGIPAPPFSASSSPYSRRLDLFGAGSAALRSGHLDTLGPLYPFRPSAQKLQFHLQQSPPQPPPFLSSSSTSNIINIANASSTSNTNNSYQIPSSDQTILNNLQNPILTFLQKSSLDDHLGMTSNSTSTTSHHENVSANLGGFNPSHHGNLRWRGEETSNGGQDHLQLMDDQAQNVSISSYNKLDGSSVSASGFQPEKGGLGNVSTRNEGMVDSWICPSDLDLCTNKQFS